MSTYYKHKRVERVDVPYYFRCEQCMKDSGPLTATITGSEAVDTSNFRTLNDKREERLRKKAHEYLVRDLKKVYQDAMEKQMISTDFKDICPCCKKPQSWGVTGLKRNMFDMPRIILILGICLGLFVVLGYYTTDLEYMSLPLAFGIMGLSVAAAAVVFLFNLIRIGIKSRQASCAPQKNLPVIEWGAVEHLLKE